VETVQKGFTPLDGGWIPAVRFMLKNPNRESIGSLFRQISRTLVF
jgi:hypothetical protein